MEPPPKRIKTSSRRKPELSTPQRPEKSPTEEQNPLASSSQSIDTAQVPESTPILPTRDLIAIQEDPRGPDNDNLLPQEDIARQRIEIDPVSFMMSRHSSSSQGEGSQSTSRQSSSTNRHSQYQLVGPDSTSNPRSMSQNNKDQLIQSLRTHKVNTITELRRIEKIFAYLDSAEVTEPMTAAWAHYVDSNNLLNELRGLTPNYPFSSECLNEAKRLVVQDPQSVRSWNYCWLVLQKIQREKLIAKHARALATKPTMWGGRTPTPEAIERLANAFITSWERALAQMLRHWDRPPSLTGS